MLQERKYSITNIDNPMKDNAMLGIFEECQLCFFVVILWNKWYICRFSISEKAEWTPLLSVVMKEL